MRHTATALINRFGAAATITRTDGATFDPATGGYTGGTTTTITGNGARMRFERSEIDGEIIQRGDFRLLFGAGTGEPQIDDVVTFDGQIYRIMAVLSTSPSGIAVMYDLHCRR